MKAKIGSVVILFVIGIVASAKACIWDGKTLSAEKVEHPTLAQAILSPKTETPDVKALTEDISRLKADPKTNDVMWWNNLAGSYLRLGQPAEAVKILEPLTNRFPNDYGVHANLGTAYHLLGRYGEAEREIRRDTEINTNAHFGLEKYHLALLQYLCRDKEYRMHHVFVAEFSERFDTGIAFAAGPSEVNSADRPQYMSNWNLATDPKLEEGVIYMATLNPRLPTCWVMLGVLAECHKDYHLAKTAFERSIELHSIQKSKIQEHLNSLQLQLDHLEENEKGGRELLDKLHVKYERLN